MVTSYIINPFSNATKNVALVAICKMENQYIREWVNYYIDLGVDKIILFDNNSINGEKLCDPIMDYVMSGQVDIIDWRGIVNDGKETSQSIQVQAYEKAYRSYNDYKWLCFFDIDEFLCIESSHTILDELENPRFNNFDTIHISMCMYDDNDIIYNDGNPVLERFTRESYNAAADNKVKSILRGGYDYQHINWVNNLGVSLPYVINPHCPYIADALKICNFSGESKGAGWRNNQHTEPIDWKCGRLKHFSTKTIEEFCRIKMARGVPDRYDYKSYVNLDLFYKYNKWTAEKDYVAKMILEKYK